MGVKCLHAHLANYLAGGDDPVGRAGRRRGRPARARRWSTRVAEVVAALDCGSNSTRLLIGAPRRRRPAPRDAHHPALPRASTPRGACADAAIERTLAVLDEYRAMMDAARRRRAGCSWRRRRCATRPTARSSWRRRRERRGVEARVLSGERGGRASPTPARPPTSPPTPRPTVVVDIGGGSTELAVDVDGELVQLLDAAGLRARDRARARARRRRRPGASPRRRAMIEAELDEAFAAMPGFADVAGRGAPGRAGRHGVDPGPARRPRLAAYDRDDGPPPAHRAGRPCVAGATGWRAETPEARLGHARAWSRAARTSWSPGSSSSTR